MKNLVSKAMERFRCRGGDCEDTCCSGWVVPLDRTSHRRLVVLAGTHPTAQKMLSEAVRFADGAEEGILAFNEEGYCGMLTDDGRCAIHAELGAEALFEVCATYPRYSSRLGDRYEHFGALSCPEAVRLSLMDEHGLELEERDWELPRKLRNEVELRSAYRAPLDIVRGALLQAYGNPDSSLAESHFFALYLTEKASEFVHESGPILPESALVEFFGAFSVPSLRKALSENFKELPRDDVGALNVVTQVLFSPRTNEPSRAKYFQHRDELLEGLRLFQGTLPYHDSTLSELASLLRQASCDGATETALSQALRRYALHFLHVTPYFSSPTPFLYSLELALRVASLRVFLRGLLHLKEPAGETERDAALVEGIYSFSRYHEHSDVFQRLTLALLEAGRAQLATGVGLAKLLEL